MPVQTRELEFGHDFVKRATTKKGAGGIKQKL